MSHAGEASQIDERPPGTYGRHLRALPRLPSISMRRDAGVPVGDSAGRAAGTMTAHDDSGITEQALRGLRAHERVVGWAGVLFASVLALFVLSAATGGSDGQARAAAAPTAAATATATATATNTASPTASSTATATATATSTSTPAPTSTPVPPTATPPPVQPPPPPAPTSTPAPPPPPPSAPALSPLGLDPYARALLDATNARRTSVGLPPLREDGDLNAIANMRSKERAELNYFAHASPVTGKNVFDLMDDYGVPYGWAGENLAKNNYPDSETVQVADQALWDSPSHHENIVNPNYTDVGIALVVDATGMKYFTFVYTD